MEEALWQGGEDSLCSALQLVHLRSANALSSMMSVFHGVLLVLLLSSSFEFHALLVLFPCSESVKRVHRCPKAQAEPYHLGTRSQAAAERHAGEARGLCGGGEREEEILRLGCILDSTR